jgi:hypothetical protein
MPGLRDKMKKALKRTQSEDQSSTPTLGKSPKEGVEVYKTGQVPPSKYRAPWNKEHQDKLHGFSFGDTFGRRKSSFSDVSPGGTRRNSSVGANKKQSQHHDPHGPRSVGQVIENASDSDDPTNGMRWDNHPIWGIVLLADKLSILVGRSRPQTGDRAKEEDENALDQQKTVTNGNFNQAEDHEPFTQDELTKALTATKISDNKEENESESEIGKEGLKEEEKVLEPIK